MRRTVQLQAIVVGVSIVGLFSACSPDDRGVGLSSDRQFALGSVGSGQFQFDPLSASTVCTVSGGDAVKPLTIPANYEQNVVASEPDFDDAIDMNTVNETGQQAGRFLYRASEGSISSVAVTDLLTGQTHRIAQRADWEALDPIVWTPWGSLLIAEETGSAAKRDPDFPNAVAGLVYELFLNPADPTVVDRIVARPAIGSKSHEGMRFDPQGNLYSISERTPGYIYKFVPDRKGDLSSGQLYALKITNATGDRTGEAEWVALDRDAVQVDAGAAGDAVQATGYGRPEDVEITSSSGNAHGGANVLYVAITSEHRVLAIDLREAAGGSDHSTAFVTDYVARGLNTTSEFNMPDNLALDHSGNLYITEDPGGSFSSGKRGGDDIWVATPGNGQHSAASQVVRFASLNDCDAEPTGIYFDNDGGRLFVNIQHRGGDRLDKAVEIFPLHK